MSSIINLDNYDIDPETYSLRDLMQGVLERVVSIYESHNVPVPARQYWTMGAPAIDCEQVVVSFVQMYLGAPGDEASTPQRCNVPRSAVLTITVARAIPTVGQTGRTPTAVDSWVLMSSINLLDQWDDTGYGPGVIATLNSQDAAGGFQTVTLQVTMVVP
jgi:hypothetical protein